MFSALRKRFHVTPATVIATLALVFAMTGGAYAASKYVITSTKQISPKVLKSLKGANGKNGTAGPAGPAGAQGAQGAQGPQGPAGTNGEKGAPGTNGGVGPTGATGAQGATGEVNTAGPLPSGKTEKGAWGVVPSGFAFASISFTIPLSAAPTPHYVTVAEWNGGTPPTACQGKPEEPTATASNLCVYETASAGTSGTPTISSPTDAGSVAGHAGKTGALVTVIGSPAEAYGTWAVTG